MNKEILIVIIVTLPLAAAVPVGAAKILNNLVSELRDVSLQGVHEADEEFENPRAGWVFLRAQRGGDDHGVLQLSVDVAPEDGADVVDRSDGRVVEGMRYLPAGKHTAHVRCTAPGGIERLVVRTMPEILYANFPMHSPIAAYPRYDWQFLERCGLLDNLNTIIGARHGSSAARVKVEQEYEPHLGEWKARGRRWIVESPVPGLRDGIRVTADEAYAKWAGWKGITHPKLDGLIADEFYPRRRENYGAWVEAIRRLEKDHAPKTFYPYVAGAPDGLKDFLAPLVASGTRFAYERYLHERRTEQEARSFIREQLVERMAALNRAVPGAAGHAIVVLGMLSAPPESLNKNPAADFKVYLDMQFHALANDTAFAGLYGVMTYLSHYADEEYLRWAARLYRHYCVEGRTGMLSTDPYMLSHIRNPDFEHGTDGWDVSAAQDGSVDTGSLKDYGFLVMRYPRDGQGDTFLLMRRRREKPNRVSQQIRNLQPGRTYSAKLFTADRQRLGTRMKHAVSIDIDGVEMIERQCFQEVFHNDWSHHAYGFDGTAHKAWFNYHRKVFRATGATARLTISDWAGPDEPGGPIGQELMLNFVEVEPYLVD
ncbi:MAG: hypothetical protein CMJ18_00395 [Phycisphaeraceae bacterium]|nr:hypothetical protein [Phycisphaeraceae bacterium]